MRDGLRERSLRRMEEIAAYYAAQDGVLAIAAFGSNAERERFDDSSDLDFLVFCEADEKARLILETDRLATLAAIDFLRVVYGDAVQLLFSDGVLCDFGIILPEQLATFPHGAGRYLWRRADWDAIELSASEPARKPAQELVEDALFTLYLGLLRAMRGEEAAALEEIQQKAALRVLALLQGPRAEVFSPLRRAELSVSSALLQKLMPGYGHSREAAAFMLQALGDQAHLPLYRAVGNLLKEIARESGDPTIRKDD